MTGSLAQLLAFWIKEPHETDEKELVISVLETVRDDIVQAKTKDGKPVASPKDMQTYLDAQITRLRTMWQKPAS
jgi:hypothetical protein